MNALASFVVAKTIQPETSSGNWKPPSIDDPSMGRKNAAISETVPTSM